MSKRETIKNSKQHGEMKKDEVITNLDTFQQTKGAFQKHDWSNLVGVYINSYVSFHYKLRSLGFM